MCYGRDKSAGCMTKSYGQVRAGAGVRSESSQSRSRSESRSRSQKWMSGVYVRSPGIRRYVRMTCLFYGIQDSRAASLEVAIRENLALEDHLESTAAGESIEQSLNGCCLSGLLFRRLPLLQNDSRLPLELPQRSEKLALDRSAKHWSTPGPFGPTSCGQPAMSRSFGTTTS